jgi:hypothetical protein
MWKGLNLVLCLILIGVLFYFFSPHFTNKLGVFNELDIVLILTVPVIITAIHFITRFFRNGRLSSRDILWLMIIAVTLSVIAAEIFYIRTETGRAILVGAYLASLGWIYTNYMTARIQRKAHTMNVLIQLRNSNDFNKHKNAVLARFPLGRPVNKTDMAALNDQRMDANAYGPDKVPLLDSAYFVANYYEFISVGVVDGDLDATMIEHTMRGIFIRWFDHIQPIIYGAQTEDNGATNPKIFANYISLVQRYKNL